MENFDEVQNKKDFRKMIYIIGGIVLVAIAVTIFILLRKESKVSFDSKNSNAVVSPTTPSEKKPLFSDDVATWTNYYWPGKIDTHYPDNWHLKEEISSNGIIAGLEIIPPTDNVEDTIFVGGTLVKCSSISKYAKSECLKNKIQVPFYTNSKNQEVLSAFSLIFQNTIITDIEK